MKLESWHSAEDKARWKIIRLDLFDEMPGEIVSADEETGVCCLTYNGEKKIHEFGHAGIRIIKAARR